MKRRTFSLKNIVIHRFLGVQDRGAGLRVPESGELASGINIIYGPNASGKTTTGRAVHELLWPGAQDGEKASVSGIWESENELWKTIVEVGHSRWEHNGRAASPPSIPPPEDRRQYWLALHELLSVEDRDLAKKVQDEMYGGLDVRGAADALGFGAHIPKTSIKPYKRYREAEEKVRELTRKQRELKREEETLQARREELAAADAAREKAGLYQTLLQYIDQSDLCEKLRTQLDAFDPRLHNLAGAELAAFEELSQRLAENRERLDNAVAEFREAEKLRDSTGYTKGQCPSPEEIRTLKSLHVHLQQTDSNLEQIRQEIAGLIEKERQLARNIGPELNSAELSTVDAGVVKRVGDFARQTAEWRAEHEAATRFQEMVKIADFEPQKAVQLERGIGLLTNWLQASSSNSGELKLLRARLLPIVAGFGVVMVLTVAVLVDPWWLLAGLIPAGLTVWGFMKSGRQVGADPHTLQHEYTALKELPVPDGWRPPAVENRLKDLATLLADEKRKQLHDEASRAQQFRISELEQRRQKFEGQAHDLAAETGLSIDVHETSLFYLVENLLAWQQTHAERVAAEARMTQQEKDRSNLLEEANTILIRRGAPAVDLSSKLEGAIETLAEKSGCFREAQRRMTTVEKEMERGRHEADMLIERLNQLLQRVGIEAVHDDTDTAGLEARHQELSSLHDAYQDYSKIRDDFRFEQRQQQALRLEVGRHAEFSENMLDLDRQAVVVLLEKMENAARSCDQLREELTALETRIKEARKQDALENALTEREEGRVELGEVRDAAAAALVGNILTQHIQARHSDSASRVLKKAAANFNAITRGQWAVDMGTDENGTAVFAAYETDSGNLKELHELSSGTRVQLLLAIRLAFVELLEGEHVRLPLILDETLSNSDREREAAAMQALLEIARSGRQVLYFTAQEDEVHKWLQRLDAESGGEYGNGPGVVWHGVASGRSQDAAGVPCTVSVMKGGSFTIGDREVVRQPLPVIDRPDEIPSPDREMDYFAYAKALQVPPWNPGDAAQGLLHAWYVLPDKGTLYKMLSAGYRTWGQVKALLDHGGKDALASFNVEKTDWIERFARTSAAILMKAGELQILGRNRRITRDDLYRSPVHKSKYIEQVADCAEAVNGDPELLIEKLNEKSVKGFGPSMITKLQNYLEAEQYIDPRPALSDEGFRARLDAFAAARIGPDGVSRAEFRSIRRRINYRP